MRRSARRFLVAGAILTGLGAGVTLGGVVLFPEIGAWAVRTRVLPRLGRELGRTISAADIEVARGRVTLRDVMVAGPADAEDAPLARVALVAAGFDFWGAMQGTLRLGHVAVEGLHAHPVRHADGRDNFRDVLARLRERLGSQGAAGQAGGTTRGSSLRPASLALTGASLDFVDASTGVRATAADLSATVTAGGEVQAQARDLAVTTELGPGAAVSDVRVVTDMRAPVRHAVVHVGGGTIRATRHITLSGVTGTIEPRDVTTLQVNLSGSYGGATERLWSARGRIDLAAMTASMDVEAAQFTFDRLDSILRDSAVVDYQDTSLSAAMHVDVDSARVAFDGTFQLDGLSVFHPMLAKNPVQDMDVAGRVEGDFDRATRTLSVRSARLGSGGVELELDGQVSLPGGLDPERGERRREPRLEARLRVPRVPCQTVLDAIPAAMVPYLEGFALRGMFHADVQVGIDWADLAATSLDGEVDIFGCKAREADSEEAIALRLAGTFEHYVEVARDEWISFLVGPENPDFVPLAEVSPYITGAFMTTEDSRFYEHQGFIPREFQSALVKNLEAGYFRFGASSITMQTVKNVLLYREKTLARKLQELFLTWYLETQLEKDRILEIYVNAIEYGPGLYGIGPAARHYFGKHPIDIDPVEAAFLASLLPSPKQRYKQYCQDRPWRSTEAKIQRVLKLMHERERLTAEEYELARLTPLVFDRAEAEPERQCKRMVRRAIENARPTNPMLK